MKGNTASVQAARERAAEIAAQARELEQEALRVAAARGAELAALARERFADSGLEERAAELAERVREAPATQQALAAARDAGDRTAERLGVWLADSGAADKMHLAPTRPRRRFPRWLIAAALLGGAGAAFARLTKPPEAGGTPTSGSQAPGDTPVTTPAATAPPRIETDAPVVTASGQAVASPAATDAAVGDDLDARIRSAIAADPRTRDLPPLTINAAQSTVFVRGSVPAAADEEALRAVIGDVQGVSDVDLQVDHDATT